MSAQKKTEIQYFMIKYVRKTGSEADWHQRIARFTSAIDADPELRGRLSYRCMKNRKGNDYYHLAGAADDQTVEILQSRDFFDQYSTATEETAGGHVEVVPLEIVGDTTA